MKNIINFSKSFLLPLFITGCSFHYPNENDLLYVSVFQAFTADEYLKAKNDPASFKGFFYQRDLAMLQSAIDAGVSESQISDGRLVSVQCSCGIECEHRFPLLLPRGVNVSLYHELILVRFGAVAWLSKEEKYRYELATFDSIGNLPEDQWARFEGIRHHLPICFPSYWKAN